MYSMFVHCPNNIYVFFETRNENYACFVFFASTYVYCMVHTVNNKVCISQKNVENLSKPYKYLNVKRISFEVLLFLSQVATIFCPYTPPRLSRFYFFTYIFWICVSVQQGGVIQYFQRFSKTYIHIAVDQVYFRSLI